MFLKIIKSTDHNNESKIKITLIARYIKKHIMKHKQL